MRYSFEGAIVAKDGSTYAAVNWVGTVDYGGGLLVNADGKVSGLVLKLAPDGAFVSATTAGTSTRAVAE